MDEEFDESTLDWDSLLAEEVVDNEGEAESLFGAKAEVTESGDPLYGIDVKLLPLNETVYSHLKESRDWTRQVKVATSQKSQQPVILGNVWSRSVQKETHPTGIDVHTKRATIREGEAKIATSEAAVKERDTIEFGLPKEDDHPIDDATLDYWSRSQVFTPVEQEPREPFRMASEDEIEPFDHEAGSVNYHVYQHQQHAHETPGDLIAQAEISPQNNNAPKKSGTVDGKNKQAQKTPPQNQPATQADQAPPATLVFRALACFTATYASVSLTIIIRPISGGITMSIFSATTTSKPIRKSSKFRNRKRAGINSAATSTLPTA